MVHALGRMHRDLKSGNILVTSVVVAGLGVQMRVKVADFGTATLATLASASANNGAVGESGALADERGALDVRVKTKRTKGVGTPLWMAPEVVAGQRYDAKADVYSFGIVMWEISSRDEPWKEVHGKFLLDELLQKILAGERPLVGPDWPGVYVKVMRQCWSTDPIDKPTFTEMVQWLE